ncbi:MAG: peptidylprolyl isomerase [Dokdonella sp.]
MSLSRYKWMIASLSLLIGTHAVIAAESAPTGAPSTILAKQGGAVVTLEDIDAFAARIPEGQRAGFFNSPTRIDGVVTNLLLQKQLAAEARKAGLDRDPAVQRQIALTAEEALGNVQLQRFKASMKLPDFSQLAQEDYIAHKKNYLIRGKLEVQHVLISTKTRSEADAKALAETVAQEAKAHPDQFDALVEKYSDDPSKMSNQGHMDNAGDATKYVPEFASAASALKTAGDISPPVKTSFGFHVVKLISRTPDKQRTFAEVKAEIIEQLSKEYSEKQMRTYTDAMRNLPLDGNADMLATLRTRYGEAEAPQAAPSSGNQ